MADDSDVIRRNIQHYRDLLQLYSTERTREQLRMLLRQAQARLAIAEAQERKH